MAWRWVWTLVVCGRLFAAVELPALVSDHMVLQRDVPLRIWGKATAGEQVKVTLDGLSVSARAGAGGKWQVFLPPLEAGGPHNMTVAGENTITVRDVLVGEVWVASGQSNMGFPVARSNNAGQEVASSANPALRFFVVKNVVAEQPAEDVVGEWKSAGPETTGAFSAVAYFFARDLEQRLKVPVGVVQSAWGGTPAQAWTSQPALEADPLLAVYFERWKKVLDNYPEAQQRYQARLESWKAEAAKAKEEGRTPPNRPAPPQRPGSPHAPAVLYNGMIAPLLPMALRGVIWYQGESNAGRNDAELYRRLFSTMIEDWRQAWDQGPFPFLFVQLANYAPPPPGTWPVLRESQLGTLQTLRNTGMAVTIDVGDSRDIHPKDKQTVGARLALWARSMVYGEKVESSGPIYRQATLEGNRMRLWFDRGANGLQPRGGGPLAGFEIAGSDRRFSPAEARIDGPTVVVSSSQVEAPLAVRYAWNNDPLGANLVNKEGLPASPFRTDHWPAEP